MKIKDALSQVGKEVEIRGWVYRHRSSGDVCFVVIRDSTGIMQAVVRRNEVDERSWKDAEDSYIESSAELRGIVAEDKRAPGGAELRVRSYSLISKGEVYPITKDQSDEFLLDVRHLWLRSRRMASVLKLRHHLLNYAEEFLRKEGFYKVDPPMLTISGAEGGSDMFELDYFGRKAYLTQSSQLYAEAAIFSLERVYTLAPSFRAEKSRTTRHLTEFWHLEPEAAFVHQKENMEIQERLVEYIAQNLLKHSEEIILAGGNPDELKEVRAPFERLDYSDAVEEVNRKGGKMKEGEDFGSDEEALLTGDRTKPIFVVGFPKEIKAFYMREDPERKGRALCADMLAPRGHGEIIGGSERIWDLNELNQRIKELKLDVSSYSWYIDLRRYGSVPHSGFGMGIERTLKWMAGLNHIRDAIPFPRTITRLYP